MTKLLENIYRCVNIALVNELKMLCLRMDLDIWEIIAAAATNTALQNAASIASLMLTTEAMVADIPEKKPAPMPGGGHGPPMDY